MSEDDVVFVTVSGRKETMQYTVHLSRPDVPKDVLLVYAMVTYSDAKESPKPYALIVTDIPGLTEAYAACTAFFGRFKGIVEISFPTYAYIP